jgi:hypothetical protein
MTFPTIPTSGAGRVLATLNTVGGATKTFPNLSSLTKNAGDLLIAICVEYDGNSTNAEFSGWGGSFTEFVDQATTTGMAIGCAYKWSTGSETGTFTVTTADTSTSDSVMILLSIPGAHPSTPPEGGAIANGTAAAADAGALDPSGWGAEDTLWIHIGAGGEVSGTGSFTGVEAVPTNYNNSPFDSTITADAVGGVNVRLGFRQLNASSENPGAGTYDLTNARNAALLLAVRPAADVFTGTVAVTLGPFTSSATGSVPVVPEAVDDLDATPGDTEVDLTWTAPADGGGAITDYIVQFRVKP